MNRSFNSMLMLIPEEMLGNVLTLLLVLGGLCLIIGAKRTASFLIVTAIALPFIAAIAGAFFNELFAVLPPQMAQLFAWSITAIIGLLLFGTAMSAIFGIHAWNAAKGQLLADAIRGLFKAIFRWSFVILALAVLVAVFTSR
ncbi:hypothetical protein [Nitrosomonas sp. wSCUT-2]